MKFSEDWLREWVDPPVTTAQLADQLSMAGLEVDAVARVAPDFSGVVVGEVLRVEAHPNAEKLRVCEVDTGAETPLTIVCGAANVAAGMRVPTAETGARLPGDFKITRARLRGVESQGMLCAASELGLAESSDGIMDLPADAPVGEDFRTYLNLDDNTIELDLTPDRGDCLSLRGIAREVGVINRCVVSAQTIDQVPDRTEARFDVSLEAPEACPRYVCRVVQGIDLGAATPIWMRERLRRSGIRSLGPVVDVTNYVMLELGQPMHGFDLERLDGPVRIRMARAGETLELLGGQRLDLNPDTLVIADRRGPLALAGIMGGEASGVGENTRDILLESAYFTPQAIIGKARRYGLHTDSSHRFERGVDPRLQRQAVERATALLIAIAGGAPGPVVEVASEQPRQQTETAIELRRTRIRRVLGIELPDAEIADTLGRLGMQVAVTGQGWRVVPPSCRFDIAIEVDLIEEIGRIFGYAEIPTSRAVAGMRMQSAPESRFDQHRAQQLLVDRGYQEVITYSFIDASQQRRIDPGVRGVELANPISAQMSMMRTSLIPGLLETARYNQARQQSRVRIFEVGRRFVPEGAEVRQDMMLAGLATGAVSPEQWGEAVRPADFFDIKADVEQLLGLNGRGSDCLFIAEEHPAMHPGQSARIEREGETLGWLGMLHPELERELELDTTTFLFELCLEALAHGRLPRFQPLSRFPSIRRDLSVVVDKNTRYDIVRECIFNSAPKILRDILLFDVYTGDKIEKGRKSLALGLILQETSHTLTDKEVEEAMQRVLQALSSQLGATLRE